MDFKQLPYLKQRDFVDPYIRHGKNYHPLLREEGHSWDTCMISSRAIHLLWAKSYLPESPLATFHEKTVEEIYFQMICHYLEDNYIKKGVKVSRYNSSYHNEMLNKNFFANKINYKYVNCRATVENAKKIISGQMPNAPAQPVIAGTDISHFIPLKQGQKPYVGKNIGTAKGHIQLFVEVREDGIVSKDPYGKANKLYKDHDGDNVLYTNAELKLLLADYCLYNYMVKI